MRETAVALRIIHWFRQDLRLADNAALVESLAITPEVLPVYILQPDQGDAWGPGAASRWWLHHALVDLQAALRAKGSDLLIFTGDPTVLLPCLARGAGASAVAWNRCYEPAARTLEARVKEGLEAEGVEGRSYSSSLLFEPWTVANQSGKPYQVFSAFWRACLPLLGSVTPLAEPTAMAPVPPAALPETVRPQTVESLELLPTIPWDAGFYERWTPTVAGAQALLSEFVAGPLGNYDPQRDIPSVEGTSRLSPYLHFGQIGPRQILAAVEQASPAFRASADVFIKELGWREFAHHLLYHFPATVETPLKETFLNFPWAEDPDGLAAWQRGQTGYPIVDAGMRQLWATGWMHNRVRMIVGSFLVKDLLIPWQAGARWFWDTLVDADLANNTLGWQWVGGCGADAAPYFRVFNPTLQGQKFDPKGLYVRRWVPELSGLADAYIHRPWEAPPLLLADAGVTLGKTYPHPRVDHAQAKKVALEAFASIRK